MSIQLYFETKRERMAASKTMTKKAVQLRLELMKKGDLSFLGYRKPGSKPKQLSIFKFLYIKYKQWQQRKKRV